MASERWSEINDAAEEAAAALASAEASADADAEAEVATALVDLQSKLSSILKDFGDVASRVKSIPQSPEKASLLRQFLSVSAPAIDELDGLNSRFIHEHDSHAREEHLRAEEQQKLAEEALAKAKKQVEDARNKYRPIKGSRASQASSYANKVAGASGRSEASGRADASARCETSARADARPRVVSLKVDAETIDGENYSCAVVGCRTVSDRKIQENVKLAIAAKRSSNISKWGGLESYVKAVNEELANLPLTENVYRNLGIEMCINHLKAVRGAR